MAKPSFVEFEVQRDRALKLLDAAGVRRSQSAPPLFRLLWRLRLPVPPPHYLPFRINLAALGGFFGLTMTGVFLLTTVMSAGGASRALSDLALIHVILGVMAGISFGGVMASYFSWSRKKRQLPTWNSLRVVRDFE